jgi:hypothetical protein
MAKTGPIQVPSNLSNIDSFPDLVRFVSAFATQVVKQFNGAFATKTVWGVIGVSGTVIAGSSNFGASLVSLGNYHVTFREAYAGRPAVVPGAELLASNIYVSGVTTTGFDLSAFNAAGTSFHTQQFSFIATGAR